MCWKINIAPEDIEHMVKQGSDGMMRNFSTDGKLVRVAWKTDGRLLMLITFWITH